MAEIPNYGTSTTFLRGPPRGARSRAHWSASHHCNCCLDRDSKVLSSSRTAGLSVRSSAIEIEHLGPSSIEIEHLHLPVLSSVAIEPLRILTNLAALISAEIEQLVPPG